MTAPIRTNIHHPQQKMRSLTHCLLATKDYKSCEGIMKIAQSDSHAGKTFCTKREVGVISSTVTTRQCVVNMACPATSKLTLQITTSPGSYFAACLLSKCFHFCVLH